MPDAVDELEVLFLDPSVQSVFLAGYNIVSRRDHNGNGSGIVLLAGEDVSQLIVHVSNSRVCENVLARLPFGSRADFYLCLVSPTRSTRKYYARI